MPRITGRRQKAAAAIQARYASRSAASEFAAQEAIACEEYTLSSSEIAIAPPPTPYSATEAEIAASVACRVVLTNIAELQ
jgi:hypothetical protein